MHLRTGELHYVITGPGRSGTTFLAHLFCEAGYDMGSLSPESIGDGNGANPIGGGMEHSDFVFLNNRFRTGSIRGLSAELLSERYQQQMYVQWPSVLKDPRFLFTFPVWTAAGILPKRIFICVRDADTVRASSATMERWDRDPFLRFAKVYDLVVHCIERDIPYTFVLYPRIGRDRAYAQRTLGSCINDPWSLIQKLWSDDMEHFRTENRTSRTHQAL